MNFDNLLKRALIRIVPVSLAVSLAAAAAGYWHAQSLAEKSSIQILSMEARRAVPDRILALQQVEREAALSGALRGMVGGVFSSATVYSDRHETVAEAVQPGFEQVAMALRSVAHPVIDPAGSYDSVVVLEQKVLRVFVPLTAGDGKAIGHLEGVRVLSAGEQSAFRQAAADSAGLAAFSVLLCAGVLAPLLTGLAASNLRWARLMTEAHLGILEAAGRAVAKRDSETGIHNYRVTWMAARMGEKVGLDAQHMRSLIAGAFLHDVGKIGIPDEILLKPGKLDDEERSVMQTHVEIGGHIAGGVGFLRHARHVIEGHHEKWDGTGYPRGRAAQSIPFSARLFCIVDVYDALRAKRPYKEPFVFEQAMVIMREGRGRHFDPLLLDVFEEIVDEIEVRIIQGDEEQTIALTRQIVRKHFFSA